MVISKIDAVMSHRPSWLINKLTNGSVGASLCARVWLYRKYIRPNSCAANTFIKLTDGMEVGHCERAARLWRLRHKKENCYFPKRYRKYLDR